MKNVLRILLSLALLVSLQRLKAETMTITYSDWSTDYPSGLNEVFIESEVRYNWYKVVNDRVEYVDEYYKELDGYVKDEASARTYYRYITNPYLLFNGNNEIVLNPADYCEKSFCYIRRFTTPTMVDTLNKENSDKHSLDSAVEIQSTVVPYTKDNIINSFIVLGISVISLVLLIVKRKKLAK